MTSIITGDIINSSNYQDSKRWLEALKEVLKSMGREPRTWQIYRGDSFQVEIKEIVQSLQKAIKIKAAIKCIKGLDVRLAIGIGEKSYDAPKITEANGEAFVNSGQLFEKLIKQNIAIKSPWPEVDHEINLLLSLALLTMDHWTPNSAEIVKAALDLPDATQKELGQKMNITQGRVSERLSRAGYEEIMKMNERYIELIQNKITVK